MTWFVKLFDWALKVAIVHSRVVNPHPCGTPIDLEAEKALSHIQFINFQREGSRVQSRVIGSRWDAWLPCLFTGTLPFQQFLSSEIRPLVSS